MTRRSETFKEMDPPLAVEDWGLVDYATALERQLEYVRKRREEEIPDTFAFTEHPPVYTFGVRKSAEANLLWDEDTLRARNVQIHKTRRGGDITFHGPGQLVGYPILALTGDRKDLHAYLRILEDTVIRTLSTLGLNSGRRLGMTGVWIDRRKICAIGVGVKHWITYHGFALNVTTDLSYFEGIIPCGITDGSVTSLEKELGKGIDTEGVKEILISSFYKLFYT